LAFPAVAISTGIKLLISGSEVFFSGPLWSIILFIFWGDLFLTAQQFFEKPRFPQ
jgi:hypothetical protein